MRAPQWQTRAQVDEARRGRAQAPYAWAELRRVRARRDSAGHAATGADPCTSHFLLQDAESALHPALAAEDAGDEGDLNCPKCRTRVGSYSWYGMQCACGAWVTPAFQVIKSKVDEAVSHRDPFLFIL